MSVYARPDSKYWWLWLETAPKGHQKVRTDILIGFTKTERKESRDDAEAVYHAQMLRAGKLRHDLPVEKDSATFDTFATWYDTHEIPRHRGHVRERKILKRLRAAFGALALRDPTWRETVIAWRTSRLQSRVQLRRKGKTRTYPAPSAATVNREVGLLQQMLGKAAELQYVPSSPLLGLRDLKSTPPLRRIMSEDEERRLLPHLKPVDRAILIMGLDTLARFGDILDLRWVDDHGDTIDLPDPKNGTALRVPVSARLRAALDALPAPTDQPYIFAERRRAATPETWHSVFIDRLRHGCAQANIPYGRTKHGVTFHWATRRTGATRMIRAGGEKAIGVVQQIGGWKDVRVLVGIYQEVITEEMRAAVETVAPKRRKSGHATPAPFPRLASSAKRLSKTV